MSQIDPKAIMNLDAEKSLIGAMLCDKDRDYWQDVALVLKEGSRELSDAMCRAVYAAMCYCVENKQPNDIVPLRQAMRTLGQEEHCNTAELGEMMGHVGSYKRAASYAELVHNAFLNRQLVQCAHRIFHRVNDVEQTAQQAIDNTVRDVLRLNESRVSDEPVTIMEVIGEVFAGLDQEDRALATGFVELDHYIKGLEPANLYIVAARPSVGKTALLLNIAERLAIFNSHAALFFSIEMSARSIGQRLLASVSDLPMRAIERQDLSEYQRQDLDNATQRLERACLHIDAPPSAQIGELHAKAAVAQRRHEIKAVFVDYLQLVHSEGRMERRELEVARVAEGLKAMAKALDIPVVAAAQLNRAPEGRTDKRPRLHDLRESGSIEQAADVVLLLHRGGMELQQDEQAPNVSRYVPALDAELHVAKQRNGPTGIVRLSWKPGVMRFGNYTPDSAVAGDEQDVPPGQQQQQEMSYE